MVAGITPWNFPVLLAVWKSPALLAGNTFILKPSPYTPLSSLALGEKLSRNLPPGVFNVVSGGDQLGRWLSAHPEVGRSPSPAPWRPVSTSRPPQPDLKRVTLELGGNDPAIVLADNNPEGAEKLFWAPSPIAVRY